MRRSNFALRLQPSLMEEARKLAESEGVALNQPINVAVAEKVSILRTEEYFRERARRADRGETLRILDRAGRDDPPSRAMSLFPPLRRKVTAASGKPPLKVRSESAGRKDLGISSGQERSAPFRSDR
jgi:hypothetical protein